MFNFDFCFWSHDGFIVDDQGFVFIYMIYQKIRISFKLYLDLIYCNL